MNYDSLTSIFLLCYFDFYLHMSAFNLNVFVISTQLVHSEL